MASVKSDIEIARESTMKPIVEIGAKIGISDQHLIPYGHTKAKVSADFIKSVQGNDYGNLILVTAINPTPAGEGKTTTVVGLVQGLGKLGLEAVAAIRQPSMGPTFGIKGGAAGGGYPYSSYAVVEAISDLAKPAMWREVNEGMRSC